MPTRTRFLVIRHAMEVWKPSNTGRLAALAMPSCAMLDYALRRGGFALPDEPRTALLFPDDGQPPVQLATPPARVIVLDGSWPQARRMAQRIPALHHLPRLALPPLAARDRLRQPPRPDGMSTLEAIAHAVALLESPDLAAPLLRLHALHVARSRAAHGDPRRPVP